MSHSHHVSPKFAQHFTHNLTIDQLQDDHLDFTFVCNTSGGSPASADDLFLDGQIRPHFPLLADEFHGPSPLRPPLRKLFVERRGISSPLSSEDTESDQWKGAPVGSYCRWSRKKAMEASKESCKKSNSTGFSRLWRFRDLKLRSNSDGNNAFVFLNPAAASAKKRSSAGAEAKKAVKVKGTAEKASTGEGENGVVRKAKAGKSRTASWAPEKHYMMSRAKKESEKRKSYLPYRQHLVGFFTNVSGFSRNVHPF